MGTLKPWKLVAFFLVAFTANASAQSCIIKGEVEDVLTGEPLIGAYIETGDEIISTDLDGKFSIEAPTGEATIEVSYIGYSNQARQIKCKNGEAFARFRMETLVMELRVC